MLDLFRAEWKKIAGNRWVSGCLIWSFPLLAVLFLILVGIIMTVSPHSRAEFAAETHRWPDQAIGVWVLPNNPIGRMGLLGFTAVIFAGEYQWSTWKNIVPRNRRFSLILIKFLTLGAFVVVAFGLMSVIVTVGWGVLVTLAGGTYEPSLNREVVSDFVGDYVLQASLAFTSTLIAAGYAALAGMFTRSILGGVLVGFAATIIEGLSLLGLALVGFFVDFPRLVHLYRLTPFYNLLNVSAWIQENRPETQEVFEGADKIILSDTLGFSLVVLALWVVGLVALTALLFQRQDITT